MQTFRAYMRDTVGEITWAAWIDAGDRTEAEAAAQALRPGEAMTVDLWSASDRRLSPSCKLDPV